MNTTQQIFVVFFAIFWGTAANAQPGWKAFQWPLLKYRRQLPLVRNRLRKSMLLLNVVPIVHFAIAIWMMHLQWVTQLPLVPAALVGMLTAFAGFGFYRVWLGFIERNRKEYYYTTRDQFPEDLRRALRRVEPTVDRLWGCSDETILMKTGGWNLWIGVAYILGGGYLALLITLGTRAWCGPLEDRRFALIMLAGEIVLPVIVVLTVYCCLKPGNRSPAAQNTNAIRATEEP